jgi:hypothetical protein
MCSKKWANPDLPGSTSFRDPVFTGIWIETMLGKPVGTTMTFRPFGRVFSVAWKGRMSAAAFASFAAGFAAGLAEGAGGAGVWAFPRVAMRARRITGRDLERRMQGSPS